jgi:uncharacterized protein (TIGR01244 family)
MLRVHAGGLALCVLLGACAVKVEQRAESPAGVAVGGSQLPQAVTGVEGMEKGLFRDGRVYVGGQPTQKSLTSLAALGVTTVVNLRTPREMADTTQVPFDEAAEAARLGMEYVAIPIGGTEFPYGPEAVEHFAQVLERRPGPVLLHCRSGVRASYLWAAYLVRFGGLGLDAAHARGRAMAIGPDPLEQLLGRPLKPVFAGPPPAPAATPAPRGGLFRFDLPNLPGGETYK